MNVIHGTRNCFDDAVRILLDFIEIDREFAECMMVVHALIIGNEPGQEGKIISHAWVEVDEWALFKGIVDEQEQPAPEVFRAERREFYRNAKVIELQRYTPRDIADLNKRHNNTGPWHEPFTFYTKQGYEEGKRFPEKKLYSLPER